MNGRWTNTLIADEQGLYDPSSTNDRMVLGIRGQVSELERDSLVHLRGLRRVCEGWPVLIQDHHPGYISFEKYLDNQERLHRNALMTSQPTDESHQGVPRGGQALLQGLMRCGHCGRRVYVNYGGSNARRTLQYRCSRQWLIEPECQLVGEKRIEAAGVEAFLLVAQAAGSESAALAGERLRAEIETAQRQWKLRIEKAEYEAQRAERQHMAVEPENRTLARELERRWNERLLELETLRDQAAKVNQGRRPLTEMRLARAQDLGMNLQAVWHDDPAAGECARFSLVAHWVKQGKLKAARTTVGNRQCWRIEVPSTSCENQPSLFDQMGNATTEEP